MMKFNNLLATVDAAGNLYLIKFSDGEIVRQFSLGITSNLVKYEGSLYFGEVNGNIGRLDQSMKTEILSRLSKRSITRIGTWREQVIAGDINGFVSAFSLVQNRVTGKKF